MRICLVARLVLTGALLGLAACSTPEAIDEARVAGKTPEDFPTATADVFRGMDGGIELTPDEIEGRNTWVMWTGGNERFWDLMAQRAFGLMDFLKVIDSRRRDNRFQDLGLINEPGFRAPDKPDQYGLYIDVPVTADPAGVDPAVYGRSTGVIGLRLFPNPNFDESARRSWDADRYYRDPTYYQNPALVRPYRVGMTCGICHVAFHPLYPPADVTRPEWRHLSGTLGNQYFRTLGVFGHDLASNDLFYQLLRASRPGALDTSILATDHNNNPNIINSIYQVGPRLSVAVEERVAGGALGITADGGPRRRVPHVLVDGADSVGVQAALNRVFVNIGTYSEEWLRDHNPIVGVRPPRPFRIALAQKNSVYWQVTERRNLKVARYLARASGPMRLADAPGGQGYLTTDTRVLDRGRIVFAENCMACHSSKRPADGVERRPENFASWARSDAFLAWARAEVMKPDFLDDNYLSTDARYPVTLLQTNAARALQDNAIAGGIWEEFSSVDYKETPSVGEIDAYDPFAGTTYKFRMPAGGPGFYRVPTLVAIWAGAPFLHNNALGEYTGDPSVEGRLKAFDDAITKMFWEDRRPGVASITRLTERTWLMFPTAYVPVLIEGIVPAARPLLSFPWLLPLVVIVSAYALVRFSRRLSRKGSRVTVRVAAAVLGAIGLLLVPVNLFAAGKLGDLKIGPFPAGTPVNLLANIDPHAAPGRTVTALWTTRGVLARIESEGLSDDEARRLFDREAAPGLLALSKSPDWVEDRGHYFASALSDDDKRALIEFLKTF
jgi:hypothetical protein